MVNNGKNIKRAGIVGLEILDELVGAYEPFVGTDGKTHVRKAKKYQVINGVNVKLSSERYDVFKKSLTCCKCGITGRYFAIECTDLKNTSNYHLNLYGIDENNQEVLMTKDHIQPKSKGGRNRQGNYQTMCVKCNGEKGNKQ